MPVVQTHVVADQRSDHPVVSGAASPCTLTIPATRVPVTLIITSASTITVVGATGPGGSVPISHTI